MTQTQVYAPGLQKWTTTTYDQDNAGVNYQMNPRVMETNIYDASGNHRRTTIDYDGYVIWGLPHVIHEYDGANTELRRTTTTYELSQPYLDRRIIGLVSERDLYDPAVGWQSRTVFYYDNSSVSAQATYAPQHDNGYSSSFVIGRGNLTDVLRWDASDFGNPYKILRTTIAYDAAGSPLSTTDPVGHANSINYSDSFSDGNNGRGTYAYPTSVTDADGYSAYVQYNFDFGAKTRTEGPPPAGQSSGAIANFYYDSATRLYQIYNGNTGGATYFGYGPNYRQRWDSINSLYDKYSFSYLDGMGRATATLTALPNGNYATQLMHYDVMGRLMQQTNPTEMTGAWVPTSDDSGGWQFNYPSEYDWKGRPLHVYNMDGSYQTFAYSGCGCAGGEVVTITDEMSHRQKAYSDVLGRQWKTEVLNDNGTVYSTTTNSLNARDQVTLVRQTDNATGAYQDTTMSYDGYGRLASRHVPEQRDQNNNPTYTTYDYNADDTINWVQDGRGVRATCGYNNNRHLVSSVTYPAAQSLPAGVAPTDNVSFGYDAAGNRTSMTDGIGTVSYSYDSLSRMSAETRTFNGVSGSFTLSYGYNLIGQLTSVTDQRSATTFSYTMDSVGRLGAISASGVGNTTVASNFQYRAWNALKHVDFGNNTVMSLGYNSRMLAVQYALNGVKELSGQSRAEGSDFQYYDDGRVKFASDYYQRSFYSVSAHDKAYKYDNVGRMQTALTGAAANNFVATGQPGSNLAGPYQQNYTHDVWDNLANRTGSYWSEDDNTGTQTYNNNRNAAWSYDSNGNLLSMNETAPSELPFTAAQHTYDAASRRVQITQTTSRQVIHSVFTTTRTTGAIYDGDGLQVKAAVTTQVNTNQPSTQTTYYLRSSVLGGQAITDYNDQATRVNSYVYAGGSLVYEQLNGQSLWHVPNPLTGDARDTDSQARLYSETHLDPEGVNAGAADPATMSDPQQPPLPHAGAYAAFLPRSMGGSGQCSIDGSETGCAFAESFRDSGAGEECLDGNCGKQQVTIIGRNGHGNVISTSTIDVMPGDPGWNGHLDGTYRVGSTLGNLDISNSSTAANLLRVFDYWGGRPNDYFAKVSSAPQNSGVGTPQDLKNSIYNDRALLAKLNGCVKSLLQKKLGKNWRTAFSRVGEQSSANTPKIDARLTSQQITNKYTQVPGTYSTGVGNVGGPHGTIFLSSEGFNNPTDWTVPAFTNRTQLQTAYIHELGNLISYYASSGTTYRLLGVNGAVDDDSGYALVACVFNEPIQMKKK